MTLAAFIQQHKPEIMERWIQSVSAVLGLQTADRAQLLDHLPEFIDELYAHLENSRETDDWQALIHSSRLHGRHRKESGIDIGGLVREFGIVQQVILDMSREAHLILLPDELSLLTKLIVDAAAGSVDEYVKLRDRELAEQASEHFAFVAHEIRNPLQTAHLALQFLTTQQSQNDVAARRLDRSLKQLRDLVDNTLVDAKLSGTVRPRITRLSIARVVEEAIDDVAFNSEKKSLSLQVEIEEALDIDADHRLLHSIMTNLLGNALKFTHDQSTITVRACSVEGGRIRLEVQDECGGLQTSEPSKLFNPFIQLHNDHRGFGLGLGIVKQAVEAHQGCVRISDIPGNGCVFIVELPRHQRRED